MFRVMTINDTRNPKHIQHIQFKASIKFYFLAYYLLGCIFYKKTESEDVTKSIK